MSSEKLSPAEQLAWDELINKAPELTEQEIEHEALREATRGWILLVTGALYSFKSMTEASLFADDPEPAVDRWFRWKADPGSRFFEWEQDADAALKRLRDKQAQVANGFIDWNDPAFWDPPEPREYVPGVLLETQVGTIYSKGGVGKSLLSLDVVVGLCVRGTIFGLPVDPADVIYIDRENSKRGLLKRLLAMGVTKGDAEILEKRMHYSLLGAVPPLDTPGGGGWLAGQVRKTGAKFVVIDTMSKIVEGEENANPTWQGLHNHTMVQLKAAGVTVLQLDHTGKDAGLGQRGASAKRDNADVVWHLELVKDNLYCLINQKDRDGDFGGEGTKLYLYREDAPLHFRMASETEVLALSAGALTDEEAEIKAEILAAAKEAGGPFSQNAAEKAVKGHQATKIRTAYKALKDLGQLAPDGTYVGASEVRPGASGTQ